MKLTNIEKLDRTNIVDFLEEIFERRGGEEYLGEPVTMAEHMLQGATIAEQNGQPEVIIVSVLLHDVGHFTSEFGMFSMDDTDDKYHEEAGAEVLQKYWNSPLKVAHPLGYVYPYLRRTKNGWQTRETGRHCTEASPS